MDHGIRTLHGREQENCQDAENCQYSQFASNVARSHWGAVLIIAQVFGLRYQSPDLLPLWSFVLGREFYGSGPPTVPSYLSQKTVTKLTAFFRAGGLSCRLLILPQPPPTVRV